MSDQDAPAGLQKQPKQNYKRGMNENDFFKSLEDTALAIALLDGTLYSGILKGRDRYNLILLTSKGLMLFPKHAIQYVMPDHKRVEHHLTKEPANL